MKKILSELWFLSLAMLLMLLGADILQLFSDLYTAIKPFKNLIESGLWAFIVFGLLKFLDNVRKGKR